MQYCKSIIHSEIKLRNKICWRQQASGVWRVFSLDSGLFVLYIFFNLRNNTIRVKPRTARPREPVGPEKKKSPDQLLTAEVIFGQNYT